MVSFDFQLEKWINYAFAELVKNLILVERVEFVDCVEHFNATSNIYHIREGQLSFVCRLFSLFFGVKQSVYI